MYKVTTITKDIFTTNNIIEAKAFFEENKNNYSYIELKEIVTEVPYYAKSLEIKY